MGDSSHKSQGRYVPWLILLAVACTLRGGWLWARFDELQDDVDGYRHLAINVIETATFGYTIEDADGRSDRVRPTAYRPPLYPLMLAAVGWHGRVPLVAVAGLHLLLGVATVGGVYALGRHWRLGNWALLAALLIAFDPILLRQSSLVMTETAATALAVAVLLALVRLDGRPIATNAVLAGAAIALAVLCRPTFLIWFAGIAATLLVLPYTSFRRRMPVVASFVVACGVLLGLWVGRNVAVLGHPVLATTHGGYTLLLGNNEGFYDYLETAPWGATWDSSALDAKYNRVKDSLDGDEVLADRWAYREAQRYIGQQPSVFLRSCLVRVGRLWGVLPHRVGTSETMSVRLQRYAVGVWYAAVFLLAIVGVFRLGRRLCVRPVLWGLMLCLSFTAVHTFYWSNLRMRGPLMPVVCLCAAVGMQSLIASIGAAKRRRSAVKSG
jgi:4-amino-4-deoxy-L-arabinose transferase-like glycosyltransferase